MQTNHPEGCDCSTCWFQRTMGLAPPEPERVVVEGERYEGEVDAAALDQTAKRGRRFWTPTEESLPTIKIIQGPGAESLYRHTQVHRFPPLGASQVKDTADRPQETITITRKDIEAIARRHAEAGRDEHDQASADAEMITAIVPPGEPVDICPNTIEALRNRTVVIPTHTNLSFEEFFADAKKIALAPNGKTLEEEFQEMHQRIKGMKERGELSDEQHILIYDPISEPPKALPLSEDGLNPGHIIMDHVGSASDQPHDGMEGDL